MPQTVTLSEFQASCADILHRVQISGEGFVVVENGKPVALVTPMNEKKKPFLGAMAGTGEILGDIITPACDESEWEALR